MCDNVSLRFCWHYPDDKWCWASLHIPAGHTCTPVSLWRNVYLKPLSTFKHFLKLIAWVQYIFGALHLDKLGWNWPWFSWPGLEVSRPASGVDGCVYCQAVGWVGRFLWPWLEQLDHSAVLVRSPEGHAEGESSTKSLCWQDCP